MLSSVRNKNSLGSSGRLFWVVVPARGSLQHLRPLLCPGREFLIQEHSEKPFFTCIITGSCFKAAPGCPVGRLNARLDPGDGSASSPASEPAFSIKDPFLG